MSKYDEERASRRLQEALAWAAIVAVVGFLLAASFARTVFLCSAPVVFLAALFWSRANPALVGSVIFGISCIAAWDTWNTIPVFLLAFSVAGVIAGCAACARAWRRSRVRLCFAAATTAFSVAHVVGYGYVALVMLPIDLRKPADHPRWQSCRQNLGRLAKVLSDYAEEHQGRLPDASVWCDAIKLYGAGSVHDFQCPQEAYARTAYRVLGLPIYTYRRPTCWRSTYGFNKHLSGARLEKVPNTVIVLFECADSWNFAGSSADIKFRHGDRAYVLFADSHSDCLSKEALSESLFAVPSLARPEKP